MKKAPRIDFSKFKLGKHKARNSKHVLRLAKYIPAGLPADAPPICDWTIKQTQPWGMMLNNQLGDCAVAAPGHMTMTWSSFTNEVVISDHDILAAYSAISGYNPSTGANDNGCNMEDVLNYWRDVGIGGHKIAGYVRIDPSNISHIKLACWLFGGLYEGVQLPVSAQDQNPQNGGWDVPDGGAQGNGAPGGWGGHAIDIVRYDDKGAAVVTWGDIMPQSWAFVQAYCDELFAVLSNDWLNSNLAAPSGFKLAELQADLAALGA